MSADTRHPQPGGQESAEIEAQAHAWARELATGQPTSQDGEAFRRWRAQSPAHERAWVQACRAWRELGRITQAYESQRPQRAAAAAMAADAARAPRRERRIFLGAAASAFGTLAAVAVVRPPLGLWPSWSELDADYRTATGEQRDVDLGSRVRLSLNTQSSVNVQALGDRTHIDVLAGEVAVSASGGLPCDITAGDASIRLAEGDIEVRRLPQDQTRLRCNTGTAQLRHMGRTIALQPGEQVLFGQGRPPTPVRMARREDGWRQGVVVFHDLTLADAVEEINRYRPGRVVLMNDALARHRLSARFEVGALDEAIVQIQQLYGAQARRVGNVVFLS